VKVLRVNASAQTSLPHRGNSGQVAGLNDYHSVDPVIVGISVDVLLHLKEAAILLSYEHVLTSLQTTWAGVVYGLLSEEQAFDITEQAQVTQR
jgi:hypothetical protein